MAESFTVVIELPSHPVDDQLSNEVEIISSLKICIFHVGEHLFLCLQFGFLDA